MRMLCRSWFDGASVNSTSRREDGGKCFPPAKGSVKGDNKRLTSPGFILILPHNLDRWGGGVQECQMNRAALFFKNVSKGERISLRSHFGYLKGSSRCLFPLNSPRWIVNVSTARPYCLSASSRCVMSRSLKDMIAKAALVSLAGLWMWSCLLCKR